jgi:hypothetical protein
MEDKKDSRRASYEEVDELIQGRGVGEGLR